MQTFYSQEQWDEYQRDLEGDGYRNEFERCVAEQLIFRPSRNEEREARRLTEAGKFVVLQAWTRLCRVTDAIIGEEKAIVKVCDTLAEAEALVAELGHDDDGDCQTYLYRLPLGVLEDDSRTIGDADPDRDDDQIPF
jgi:hypothetical protein